MTMKALLFLAAFAAVNACSKDNPCLYYGACVTLRNTSFCKCQPGYTGAFCENKLRGVVCGIYTYRKDTYENKMTMEYEIPLRLERCPEGTKCFNGKSKGNVTQPQESYTVDVSWRRCVNASYCSRPCAHLRDETRSVNVTSCNISCCDGDFCNVMELFVNRTLVVSPCESSPCFNGGSCEYANYRNYICVCQPYYKGRYCERFVNPCKSSPCLNGGTCKYANRNYTCVCEAKFTGSYCERNASHPFSACRSNPCGINATCIDDNGKFSCVHSVRPEQSCEIGLKYNALRYVVGVLTGVIIALLLCILLLIHRQRKRNRMMPAQNIQQNADGGTNPSNITSHATSEISHTRIQEPLNNNQPEFSCYMDLKPRQDKDEAYQSLDVYANENILERRIDGSNQSLTAPGEYMDLKPKQSIHYEELGLKDTTTA